MTEHPPTSSPTRRRAIWLSVLAASASLFVLTSRWGINLADGGYYYYGVLRVLAGETPGVDFQAYDPIRYYWSAAWAWIFGDQLLVVHLSRAAFAAVGIAAALTTAARATRSNRALAVLGFGLFLVGNNQLGIFVSCVTLAVLHRVLDAPAVRPQEDRPKNALRNSLLVCALWVGLAGCIGHNFALYISLGAIPAFLIATKDRSAGQRARWVGLCLLATTVGYLPMLAHIVLVPGFAQNLWNVEIARYLDLGTTNIPLPVPWPWTAAPQTPLLLLAEDWAQGAMFILVPLIYVAASVSLATGPSFRRSPTGKLLLAAALAGAPYIHYAFSRADMVHMRSALPVASVVSFALLLDLARSGKRKIAIGLAAALIAVTAAANLGSSARLHALAGTDDYVAVDIRGSAIMVRPPIAAQIEGVRATANKFVSPGEEIFIGPNWPMMYCILDRRSPTWEIFDLYDRSSAFQERMIEQLRAANVHWAILADIPADGREDRRFSRQLPLVWDYIQTNFRVVEAPALPPPHKLYRLTE